MLVLALIWISLLILLLFSNRRAEKNFIQATQEITLVAKDISSQIQKIYFLMDTLSNGVCNPISKMIYLNIRNLKAEEMPKDHKDFCILLQKISSDQFLKATQFFQERINSSECQEESDFYEEKLSKLQNIKTMIETIDENSSPEFVELIHQELAKSVMEFNTPGEDE
jgi:hypothetical protein